MRDNGRQVVTATHGHSQHNVVTFLSTNRKFGKAIFRIDEQTFLTEFDTGRHFCLFLSGSGRCDPVGIPRTKRRRTKIGIKVKASSLKYVSGHVHRYTVLSHALITVTLPLAVLRAVMDGRLLKLPYCHFYSRDVFLTSAEQRA
ncbi:hypothetical protein EVAR_18360_1 [Eumeta japonica]|uniref:Uncharacterized protein n=1 Tax=Eumeta variegata TaxID=151549 RepID=A0A4C1UTT8_EUMVA|nr:hypothetical protein EVAR_18360_1 [Eumeta japonica]